MSAVICKRRFLHENEIVQYLQNYKYEEVNQGRFRKTKQASTNVIKNNYPKTAHTFFTGCSIFSYFFTFNLTCYNFRTANFILVSQNRPKFTVLQQPIKK